MGSEVTHDVSLALSLGLSLRHLPRARFGPQLAPHDSMFQLLKTFLFGYDPNPNGPPPQPTLDPRALGYAPHGGAAPDAQQFAQQFSPPGYGYQAATSAAELSRRGWRPHRFGQTNVVLLLPPEMSTWMTPQGAMYAGENPPQPTLLATLQRGFDADPSLALDFVEDLAEKRGLQCHTVGTYRCFYDPTSADPQQVCERYFIIGWPGSVVVLNLKGTRDAACTIVLNQVRAAIPHVAAEMG